MNRILLIAALLLLPIVAGLQDYQESYDGFTPPETPEPTDDLPFGQFYDYSSTGTGTFRTSNQHAISGNSYRLNDTQDAGEPEVTFDFRDLGFVLQDTYVGDRNAEFRVAFMFAELPTGTEVAKFYLDDDDQTKGTYCAWTVSAAGAVTVATQANAGTTEATQSTGLTITTNQWVNITVRDVTGSTGGGGSLTCAFYFPDQDLLFSVTDTGSSPDSTGISFLWPNDANAGTTGRAGDIYIDNLQLVNGPDPPPPTFGAVASVAVTGLVGFDVSEDYSAIVARVDSGPNVTVYDPGTLAEAGRMDTNCNRDESVMASENVVAFLYCNSGTPADVDEVRIRSGTMNDPRGTMPWCGNNDVCPIDVSTEPGVLCAGFGSWDDEDVWRYMRTIRPVPMNYQFNAYSRPIEADSRAWAFAYTAYRSDVQESIVGVAEYTAVDNGCDDPNEEAAIYSTGASNIPDDLCSWTTNNRNYVGATASAWTTRVYEWTLATPTTSSGERTLDGSISSPNVYGIGARGISCSGDKALVTVDDGLLNPVKLINLTTSEEVWSKQVTGPKARGVHLSGNGQFAYWANGSQVHMAYASNGTEVAIFTLPTANYRDMFGDPANQRLYVAGSDFIARYNVQANLSNVIGFACIGVLCDALPSLSTTPATGGLVGVGGPLDPATAGGALGVGSFGGGLFLGVLMMAGMAVGTAGVTYRWNIPILGAMIGLVLGFLLAWAFGWFSTAAVFAIVLLIGAGYGARVWFQRSRGGD